MSDERESDFAFALLVFIALFAMFSLGKSCARSTMSDAYPFTYLGKAYQCKVISDKPHMKEKE